MNEQGQYPAWTVRLNFINGSVAYIVNVVRDAYRSNSNVWQFMDEDGNLATVPVQNLAAFSNLPQTRRLDKYEPVDEENRELMARSHAWQQGAWDKIYARKNEEEDE